jgi:hypothetical protein
LRGVIQNVGRKQQINDFSELRFGNITPTDMDGCIEYKDKAYIFIFHVPGLKPPPLGGQLLAWLYARQYLKGKLSLFQHGTNNSGK